MMKKLLVTRIVKEEILLPLDAFKDKEDFIGKTLTVEEVNEELSKCNLNLNSYNVTDVKLYENKNMKEMLEEFLEEQGISINEIDSINIDLAHYSDIEYGVDVILSMILKDDTLIYLPDLDSKTVFESYIYSKFYEYVLLNKEIPVELLYNTIDVSLINLALTKDIVLSVSCITNGDDPINILNKDNHDKTINVLVEE